MERCRRHDVATRSLQACLLGQVGLRAIKEVCWRMLASTHPALLVINDAGHLIEARAERVRVRTRAEHVRVRRLNSCVVVLAAPRQAAQRPERDEFGDRALASLVSIALESWNSSGRTRRTSRGCCGGFRATSPRVFHHIGNNLELLWRNCFHIANDHKQPIQAEAPLKSLHAKG